MSWIHRGRCRTRPAILVVAVLLAIWLVPPAHAGGLEPVLVAPTDAAVLDPFRLPHGPYGPGNRGIEYATSPGDPIRAPGAGVVSFAGLVASSSFVTVDHGGGLVSTAGFVGRLMVAAGDRVSTGRLIAVADGPFHFGVRLHGDYVDPASLLRRRVTRVRLVPHTSSVRPLPTTARVAGAEMLAFLTELVRGALRPPPATLLDGPNGPRTVPGRHRRNH